MLHTMYIEPWFNIIEYPEGHADALSSELEQELASGHPLYGLEYTLLAKREDCDDILIQVGTDYFIVHLTWSGQGEALPFPLCQKFSSIAAMLTSTR